MIKISKKDTIAIFAYNRPSHLRRVLISLENYKIPKAYIFLDGPRNKKDKILQKEIVFNIKYNPYIDLKLIRSSKNKGLAKSIMFGINYLSKKFENIIILEDDCVPRKEFFIFINKIKSSKYFKKNHNPICGYQFPQLHSKENKLSTVILNYFIPWGWCVSTKLWSKYIMHLKKKSLKTNDNLIKKISKICSKKENKSIWSKKFIEFNLIFNKKIIFPNKSLIKNIGFDGSGINSSITNKFNTVYSKLSTKNVKMDFKQKNKLQQKQKKILFESVKYFF